MPKCPVCNTEYNEEIPEYCSVCGWQLMSYPPASALSTDYLKTEAARLHWAQQMWQATASSQAAAFSVKKNRKGKGQRNRDRQRQKRRGNIKETSPDNNKDLQAKLEEVQAQLQQASLERYQLQSQLEWVLYRLEQIKPEQVGETLWRIEERLNAMPTPEAAMSEVGMDYNPLINLLAAGKWRKAEELTWATILQVVLRDDEGWLRSEDIDRFPCTDLATIDWVWEYYSDGLFGLSVQRRIWDSLGGDYTAFCDRVGWRERDNWKYYDELRFNLQAPEGHLPAIPWRRRACYGVGKLMAGETFAAFFSRLFLCGDNSQGAVSEDLGE